MSSEPKKYELGAIRKSINALVGPMTRFGLAGKYTYTLTVRGRKSGKEYSTPVRLIEGEHRWLVAPYGEVGWVRNARAAGSVTLSQRGRSEVMAIEELDAEQSAPVLKKYFEAVAIVRPYFDATADSSLAEFAAEADRHPVFQLKANE
jgi:deazaflavin-dependent oxidoreductase (nitroreductase family)